MTKQIAARAIAGWACAALVASPALAASEEKVAFCGPVVALTEAGCIGVKADGTTYELGDASPRPQVGAMIAGSGMPSDKMTTCMEGKHLTAIKWQAVTACPAGTRPPTGY
jgi:hypothetical protein